MDDQMENKHDRLSSHELRQLWTRFEGLVGHQLHRLQDDGGNKTQTSPNKSITQLSMGRRSNSLSPGRAGSSAPVLVDCNSSMCSALVSDVSSVSAATSPARLSDKHDQQRREQRPQSVGESCVDGYNGQSDAGYADCVRDVVGHRSDIDSGSGGDDQHVRDRDSQRHDALGDPLNSPVDMISPARTEDIKDRGSCVDGDVYIGVVEEGSKVEGGDGDGVDVDPSLSCCLMPSCGSSTSDTSLGREGGVMKRNSSTNAMKSCESQPLCGLPYVARAAGPLLSLLNVSLSEWDGKNGPIANTLLKLKDKRRENKRNMIGVYKQSLLLESQLHQYLNPGLAISLNRRVARAMFDAEMMAKLIDKLEKESKRSVEDPGRSAKVMEVNSKIKSLLGRQKCEWQCVGRLKETLTMAKEMKDLLRFIAKLSNTLEKSKSAFGGLQDRPPPYDYCSPYSGITKILSQETDFRSKSDTSDARPNVGNPSYEGKIAGEEVKESPQRFRSSRGGTSHSELSVSGRSGASGDFSDIYRRQRLGSGQSVKSRGTSRARSLTPSKCSRSLGPKLSKSTNFEPDSYSSLGDSHVFSTKSSARDEFSENSNVSSKPVAFNLPTITLKDGKYVEQVWTSHEGEYIILDRKTEVSHDHVSGDPNRSEGETKCDQKNSEKTDTSGSNRHTTASKVLKSGSPPRARPKEGPCREYRGGNSVGQKRPPPNERWDKTSHRSLQKMSHVEGPSAKTDTYSSLPSDSKTRPSGILKSKSPSPQPHAGKRNSSLPAPSVAKSKNSSPAPSDVKSKNSSPAPSVGKSKNSSPAPSVGKSKNSSPAPSVGKSKNSSPAPGVGNSKNSSPALQVGKSRSSTRALRASKNSPKKEMSSEEVCSESETPSDSYDQCSSCGCSDACGDSNKSGSICINIESEYPNKSQTASCRPGCRRIKVKINKRSSSITSAKKEEKVSLEKKEKGDESLSKDEEGKGEESLSMEEGKESISKEEERVSKEEDENVEEEEEEDVEEEDENMEEEDENVEEEDENVEDENVEEEDENVEEKRETRESPEGSSGSEVPDAVVENRVSHTNRPETLLGEDAPPSMPPSKRSLASTPPHIKSNTQNKVPQDKESREGDRNPLSQRLASESRANDEDRNRLSQRLASESRANDEDPAPNDGSLPAISNYNIPWIGRLDKPWKLLLAGLLALMLLYLLMSLMSGKCCGCGYFPNPFFYLTNSLAGRVTLRHSGLAPT